MSISCTNIKRTQSNGNLDFINSEISQWREEVSSKFTYEDSQNSIILFGGLTILQDKLLMSTVKSMKEQYVALPNPDFDSFRTGKAYGNRGQCNPTYFTVGNLVKYLLEVQKNSGMSAEEIVQKYVYVTASGCGPCRFGMYITEYRKALNDAGFKGFRLMSFEHNRITDTEGEETLEFPPSFFIRPVKAAMAGDILTLLTYQMRPYEVEIGAVDRAIQDCYDILSVALENRKSLTLALYKCRQVLKRVKLNRLTPKPKVMIIGEFWAAMTEGEGNYNLHRFLESEGAEVIPQPIMNRLLLSMWEYMYFEDQKSGLSTDSGTGYLDFSTPKRKILMGLFRTAFKVQFTLYAKMIGLSGYKLPDIEKLARLGKEYFPLDVDGGEGHMEVSHLLESLKHKLSHMVISVKPFGCMPSSAISDGIQSLVVSRYPEANFLSIETSGEGAANFYSRVQMALFKAKQAAKEEFESLEMVESVSEKAHDFSYAPKSDKTGTAAKLLDALKISR